jgi:hypothetical protein
MKLKLRRQADGSLELLTGDGYAVQGVHVISVHSNPEAELRNYVTVTFRGEDVLLEPPAQPVPVQAVPEPEQPS